MPNLVASINQPLQDQGGTGITYEEFFNKKTAKGTNNFSITALNKNKGAGELGLLTFDTSPNDYDGNGKLIQGTTGFNFQLPGKTMMQKNVFKVFDSKSINFNDNGSVTVTEFGNDTLNNEATADINNSTIGTFKYVDRYRVGDTVKVKRLIKGSASVISKVKIVDIDLATKELTFNVPVKIDQGDAIFFISAEIKGCKWNDRPNYSNEASGGKEFTYHQQRFAETVTIDVNDFDKKIGNEFTYGVFKASHWDNPSARMYTNLSTSIREGSGVGGVHSEITGYNTIVENRHNDPQGNLESIVDFSALTTAEDMQKKLELEMYKIANAPIDATFVMLTNASFKRSYKNMLQKLRADKESIAKCCDGVKTLHDGIVEWKIEEAPMIKTYESYQLTEEYQYEGKAYILPISHIALFTSLYSDSKFMDGKGFGYDSAVFGKIAVKLKEESHECKTYEFFMKAGVIYGGVSFRDTFKRFDNFNFEL